MCTTFPSGAQQTKKKQTNDDKQTILFSQFVIEFLANIIVQLPCNLI